MTDIAPDIDEYRVRVWQVRRHHWFGRWGWTTTVDYLSAWNEHGDQELLNPRDWWSETQDEAVQDGLTEARAIHDATDPDLPLVVHVGGRTVIDERAEVTR